jgi:hypothetical protein
MTRAGRDATRARKGMRYATCERASDRESRQYRLSTRRLGPVLTSAGGGVRVFFSKSPHRIWLSGRIFPFFRPNRLLNRLSAPLECRIARSMLFFRPIHQFSPRNPRPRSCKLFTRLIRAVIWFFRQIFPPNLLILDVFFEYLKRPISAKYPPT